MDRETATVTEAPVGADLIDLAEVKRRPRKPRPVPTPDELLQEFARAVRRTLLADLAAWPEAWRSTRSSVPPVARSSGYTTKPTPRT